MQSYGETVDLPIKKNRRPLLIKKLNHLRSRNKPLQQKGKGKQPVQRPPLKLAAFSSDESDEEPTSASSPGRSHAQSQVSRRPLQSSASSKITEVVTRSLRRRPNVSPLSVAVWGRKTPDSIDRTGSLPRPGSSSTPTPSQRRRRDVTTTYDEVSPDGSNDRSPLLRDISALSHGSTSRDTSFSDRSTIPFESSDSDIEGSSYEVENKSVNTTFTLTRGGRTPTSNHVSPNRQSYSTGSYPETNHVPSRSSPTSRGRPRRRFYPEHVSFGLVALVLAFFVIIFFGYMFVRKELFMGWFFTEMSTQGEHKYNILLYKLSLSLSLCFTVCVYS